MTTISVVVPFYDTARYLGKCLSALENQEYPRDKYEIIAIDNNSTDGSLEIAKQFKGKNTKILRQSKQGSYATRNLGIQAARGEIIAFTDSDCQPASDWLKTIESSFRDVSTEVLLGRNHPANRSMSLSLLTEYEHVKNDYVFNSGIKNIFFGHTNNMAIRTAVFARLGMFEERYRGGDSIFVASYVNVYGCGGVRYNPCMQVRHLELNTLADVLRKYYVYAQSRRSYAERFQIRTLRNSERVNVFLEMASNSSLSTPQRLLTFVLLLTGWLSWNAGDAASRIRAILDKPA